MELAESRHATNKQTKKTQRATARQQQNLSTTEIKI